MEFTFAITSPPAGQLTVRVREAQGPKPSGWFRKKKKTWHLELSYGAPGSLTHKQTQPTSERRAGFPEAYVFPVQQPEQEKLVVLMQKHRKKGGFKTVGWIRLDLGAAPQEMSAEREYRLLKGSPTPGPGASTSSSLKVTLSLAYQHKPGAAPWPKAPPPKSELQARIQAERGMPPPGPRAHVINVVNVDDDLSSALDLTEREAVAGIRMTVGPPPPMSKSVTSLEGMIPKPNARVSMDLYDDSSFHASGGGQAHNQAPGSPAQPPPQSSRDFGGPGPTPAPIPACAFPAESGPDPAPGPAPAEDEKDEKTSFWKKLKSFLGKEITDGGLGFSIPIKFFEPSTNLTRATELFEHSELLDKAVASPSATHRACLVAAVFVAEFRSCLGRKKPLMSMLGETFEWTRPDGGARVVAEMTESHPPSFGVHAEGLSGWHTELCPKGKAKFLGNSLEINFMTRARVRLAPASECGRQEVYRWTYPSIIIHNLLFGKRWFEWVGNASLECEETGLRVELKFEKAGWTDSRKWEVNGRLLDRAGNVCRTLAGRYHEWFAWKAAGPAPPGEEGGELWRTAPIDEERKRNPCNMTPFALALNDPGRVADAPPTDSRRRGDLTHLLRGDEKAASPEKDRIEEKQRARRREAEKRRTPHRPRWFKASGPDPKISRS
eukprot:tig00020571_g11491.t1